MLWLFIILVCIVTYMAVGVVVVRPRAIAYREQWLKSKTWLEKHPEPPKHDVGYRIMTAPSWDVWFYKYKQADIVHTDPAYQLTGYVLCWPVLGVDRLIREGSKYALTTKHQRALEEIQRLESEDDVRS